MMHTTIHNKGAFLLRKNRAFRSNNCAEYDAIIPLQSLAL